MRDGKSVALSSFPSFLFFLVDMTKICNWISQFIFLTAYMASISFYHCALGSNHGAMIFSTLLLCNFFWLFPLRPVHEEMNFQRDTYSYSQKILSFPFTPTSRALSTGVIFGSLCVKTSWLAVCYLMLMGA